MATTRKYLNHLLQTTGITPACSEEERVAAEDIARIFSNHGFDPEIQEFSASDSARTVRAILGIVVFIGALFMGIGGAVGIVGIVLAIAGGVLYLLERFGRISFSGFGGNGLSQNVIAYHKASGPLASPRNRPVVVVAHYDSPRADVFARFPYASYRPIITKLLPYAMMVPAIIAIVRLFPFSSAAKTVLWLLALVAALVPLAASVGILLNRFILPYTSGSVCNKSSVAAMLGVMDAVAPFGKGEEFPDDIPFEDYFSEQVRQAEEAERAAAVAAGDLPEDELGVPPIGTRTTGESGDTLGGTASLSVDGLTDSTASIDGEEPHGQTAPIGAESTASFEVPATAGSHAAPAEPADEVAASVAQSDDVFNGGEAAPVIEAEPVDQPDVVHEEAVPSTRAVEASVEMEAASETPTMDGRAAEADRVSAEAEMAPEEQVDAVAMDAGQANVGSGDAESSKPGLVNALGNYRFGAEVIKAIGMVPADCAIEYVQHDEAPAESIEDGSESTTAYPGEYGDSADAESAAGKRTEAAPLEPAPAEMLDAGQDRSESSWGSSSDDEYPEYADDRSVDEYEYEDEPSADAYDDYDSDESFAPLPRTSAMSRLSNRGGTRGGAHTGALSETLSAVSSGAKRLFNKGKSLFESMTAHGQEDQDEQFDDEVSIASQFDDMAYEEVETYSFADDFDSDSPANPISEDGSTADDERAVSEQVPSAQSVDTSPDATAVADLSAQEEESQSTVTLPSTVNVEISQLASTTTVEDEVPGNVMQRGGTQAFGSPAVLGDSDATAVDDTVAVAAVEPDDPDATVAHESAGAVSNPPTGRRSETGQRIETERQLETVDSLMAEISRSRPAPRPAPRQVSVPDPAAPSINQPVTVNRASLFDLPDPGSEPVDPFAADPTPEGGAQNAANHGTRANVPTSDQVPAPMAGTTNSRFEVISADDSTPQPASAESAARGEAVPNTRAVDDSPAASKRSRGGLFHRKKREESSMSDWLGVDDDFDAKNSGRDIGSWDNFENDSWKGGAASAAGASEEDMRDAITSLGDDELLGHDIWFVATGASEYDNAGIQAFLDTHRDKLRGVFLINLESVGAGTPTMLATEGGRRVLKGDKRIMNLVSRVSSAFHRPFDTVEMPFITTDAYRAMNMSLRSLTIAGVENGIFACSHSEDDLPYRVNEKNVRLVADVVTEVIRRS